MGLLNIIESAVRTANNVTLDLQSDIKFRKYIGQDLTGEKTYSPASNVDPITLRCIVEDKQKIVKTPSGELSQSNTTLTFLDVAKLLSATNGDGIKEDDMIILPNGETGDILSVGGFINRNTKIPVATEVYLG